MIQSIRLVITCGVLYALSVVSIGYLVQKSQPISTATHAATLAKNQIPNKPVQPRFVLVSGKPIRIVIPSYGIDLSVDEGYYDPQSSEWTLSDTHAQFAMMTALANNASGNTFIYGHGTDAVFGKIGENHPPVGAQALIYTDNGHVLSYVFSKAQDMTPNDTSIFSQEGGPSRLTIQTCTGVFSEWRTMFQFDFEKVIS